ncbi:MAG: YitT family protein [candidate division WOR-3 bacterium]|nr:YitT family protein [candidate division WOR-3 bacterium]
MNYVFLSIGILFYTLSYAVFLIPHSIVPGGVSGLAIIFHILFKTPVGIMVIIFNIPLFILAIRILGFSLSARSVATILVTNLLIDFFTYTVKISSPTQNTILASIYGGVMLGIGLGLIFRGGANTGGTDIVGQILNRFTNFSVGIWILIVDTGIITFAGIATNSIELALLGYLSLFISTRVIDLILEGFDYARAAFVVSEHTEKVVEGIYEKLGRGVTVLEGYSPYTKAKRPVIMCVITKRETENLKRLVKAIDNNAFVILTDVFEVLGHGFRPRV